VGLVRRYPLIGCLEGQFDVNLVQVSRNEELYGSIRNCPGGTCEIPVKSTGIDY